MMIILLSTVLLHINVDLPLAYNVLSSAEDPRTPNMISISWMGQSEASISVKINCISTEFTAKKHGGEKGVPFRLQVDTYAVMDDEELNIHLLHRAFCVIKVFKVRTFSPVESLMQSLSLIFMITVVNIYININPL